MQSIKNSQGKRDVKLKTILLIALSLSLISCKPEQEEFPQVNLFSTDFENKVCGEWEIVDRRNLKWKLLAEHPIEKCNIMFGFDPKGFSKVKNWARDIQRKHDNNLSDLQLFIRQYQIDANH